MGRGWFGPRSEEYREAQRQLMLGRKITWCDKLSEAHLGNKHSEETKRKMRGPRGPMRDRVGRGKFANGYIYLLLPWTTTKLMEHHVVWVMHHGPIPKGMIIHHKNETKQDNRIENLELMIDGDHRRHHLRRRHYGL